MSPANTDPRLTPMRMGIGSSVSAILRSASSIRSSSSPVTLGAPDVRISLPPSASTSEARNATSRSSVAASTALTRRWSASAAASGPSRSIKASMPLNWMKAIVTGRCSDDPPPSSTCARIAGDRQRASISNGIAGRGCSGILATRPPGSRLSSTPGPFASPRQRAGSSAAVSVLSRISPASAACSIATRRLQPGPAGSNSTCGRADREEMEFARMHALRHPQRDLRTRNLDPADGAQHAAHQRRRTAGAFDVALALEPEQQCVAAELEQAAAVLVGDLEDRFETAADRLGDLLRALAALAGEPLRQLGEPGDIDERGGAVARPVACFRVFEQMPLEDPRNVAPCVPDVGCGVLRRVRVRSRRNRRKINGHGSGRSQGGVSAAYDKRFTGERRRHGCRGAQSGSRR